MGVNVIVLMGFVAVREGVLLHSGIANSIPVNIVFELRLLYS